MARVGISDDEIEMTLGSKGFFLEKEPRNRILGRGSFGIVVSAWQSVDVESGTVMRNYAIKVMKVDSNQPKLLKYQRRELELLTKTELSHPNIIRYFGYWEHQEILAIQMELCSYSLIHIFDKTEEYPEVIGAISQGSFYQHVFPQILKGLVAIHTLGWVHRDIHPGNILVANKYSQQVKNIVIKIADFGLARHIGPMTTNLSTQPEFEDLSSLEHSLFRAPEMSKRRYDHKVDLYSAGIVLYTLSGHSEHDPASLLGNIEKLRVRALTGKLALYLGRDDEILLNLLVKLLNTKPQERPSARECLESLKTRTDGAPPTHTPKPVPTVFVKRKGEESYDRCNIQGDSFDEFQEKIRDLTHIPPENQKICEEKSDGQGSAFPVNITCDKDLNAMLMSPTNSRDIPIRVVVESIQSNDQPIPQDEMECL